MADESGVAVTAGEGDVRRITELRVVDLKAQLKKRNLDINGNKSALMERLRQVIQEEGGNPDEISISPETPNNRTSKRVGKGHRVEDGETEDCAEEDFGGKQEDIEAFVDQVQDPEVTNISGPGDAERAGVEGDVDKGLKLMPDLTSVEKEPKGTTEDATEGEPIQVTEETEAILEEAEKENVAENSGEACSSVPTEEEPPEDPQLLMQYMIDMDAYQKEEENSTLTKVQVEDILTLDVDSEMHLDGPKMEMDCQQPAMEKVDTEKMDTTESTSKMESCQQEHEVEEAEAENMEKEPQLGPEECKDNARKPEDEGSDEAAKKEPSIVEGSDQKKSSVEDGKDTTNEANQEKGRPDTCRASDTAGKNLWVSGLTSATRATDLKNLFSKYGKVICAKVVTDARNPGARCYGFITMLTPEEATESISSLNQSELNGQTITVEMAKSEPGCKKHTEQKEANVKKVSKPSSSRRNGNDGNHSRDKSSVNRKRNDRKDSRGDSKKLKDDGRKDRRREKDDGGHRSHSRSRGSERRRNRERRRARSRIRRRRSRSRDKRRDFVSFGKLITRERDRERDRDHKRDFWETEKHREQDRESRREREGREMLERERDRLQIERMRLERERLEREALERERLLIEGERRREQERIHREREELFREIRYEQTLKRPYDSSLNRDWNTGNSRKVDGFHDHSWQGSMDGGMMSRDHWQGGDRGMSGLSVAGYNLQRGGGGGLQNQGNYMQGSMALDHRSNQMMSGLNMSGGNASGGYHRPY